MLETVKTYSSPLELDKALHHAVTLAWDDLTTPIEPRAIRVEYLCEPGSPLDHLSVWSVRAGGYQDLVCDFWASASRAHPSGACLGNRHSSDKLAATLDFIMKNQGQFTRPADAGRHGLVLVYPPDGDDRIEAATWMKGIQAPGIEVSPEDAHQRRPEVRVPHQEEKAWASTDEEAHLHERNATVSHEPVEAPARTNAANYFELRYAWPE